MKSISRKLSRTLISIFGTLLIVSILGIGASYYVAHKIEDKLISLNVQASTQFNLFTSTVHLTDVAWITAADSTHSVPHSLKLGSVYIAGINIYQLVINKEVHIRKIVVKDGNIQYNKSYPSKSTKDTANTSLPYKIFLCNDIIFKNIDVQINNDTIVSLSTHVDFHIEGAHLTLDTLSKLSYKIKGADVLLDSINISRYEGLYGSSIKSIHVNTKQQRIVVDSVLLIPNYSKLAFAQRFGKETGRINLSVPQLIIEGIQFDKLLPDSLLFIAKININSFDLLAFKDKRLPFLRKENMPLPMESFLKLPWHIKVDSVIVHNSHIVVEEIAPEGIESGIVTFHHVNATISGLDNRIDKKDKTSAALLNAEGFIMGTGKIKAVFTLPLDGESAYNAKGTISNLLFTNLNQVLTPMANIRVESGKLNNLAFNFNYTDWVSKGEIEIDYDNLRIIGLNKNKSSTNEVKTFLINAFIKNKKDKPSTALKQTGVIDIERDRKRFIFNVWWKSILDGLKSSMIAGSSNRKGKKKNR